jgi:hypothetical protein
MSGSFIQLKAVIASSTSGALPGEGIGKNFPIYQATVDHCA